MPTPNPDESEIRGRLRELFRRIQSEHAARDVEVPPDPLHPTDEASVIANWFRQVERRLDHHEEALFLLDRLLCERDASR